MPRPMLSGKERKAARSFTKPIQFSKLARRLLDKRAATVAGATRARLDKIAGEAEQHLDQFIQHLADAGPNGAKRIVYMRGRDFTDYLTKALKIPKDSAEAIFGEYSPDELLGMANEIAKEKQVKRK